MFSCQFQRIAIDMKNQFIFIASDVGLYRVSRDTKELSLIIPVEEEDDEHGGLEKDRQVQVSGFRDVCVSGHRNELWVSTECHVNKYCTDDNKLLLILGSDKGMQDGSDLSAKFYEPCGIMMEGDTLFIADNNRLRIVSPVLPLLAFLRILGLLYTTFGMHKKGTPRPPRIALETAIKNMQQILQFFVAARDRILSGISGQQRSTNGPDGSISAITLDSLQMMVDALVHILDLYTNLAQLALHDAEMNVAPVSSVDVRAMRTLIVENFFALMRSRAGKPMPLVLEFGNQFLSTCCELLKRISTTSFWYFTSVKSHYSLTSRINVQHIEWPKKSRSLGLSKKARKALMRDTQDAIREKGARALPQNTTRMQYCKYRQGSVPTALYENEVMGPSPVKTHSTDKVLPLFGEMAPEGEVLDESSINLEAKPDGDCDSEVTDEEHNEDEKESPDELTIAKNSSYLCCGLETREYSVECDKCGSWWHGMYSIFRVVASVYICTQGIIFICMCPGSCAGFMSEAAADMVKRFICKNCKHRRRSRPRHDRRELNGAEISSTD